MSATTEILLEEIKTIETQLREAERANDAYSCTYLSTKLKEARSRLERANETLTENRSILKG